MEVFILLPESEPTNSFMHTNEALFNLGQLKELLKFLNDAKQILDIELFEGYFDLRNIENFLNDLEALKELYPFPAKRMLMLSLKNFNNYRDNQKEDLNGNYEIYNTPIQDHTFSEICERKITLNKGTILLSKFSHKLSNSFVIIKNGSETVTIESVENTNSLNNWLAKNRMPKRNFQIIPKHGENRTDIRIINGETISPLMCSKSEAEELLKLSIGELKKELFFIDAERQKYIVFRFEGDNPQNMYHGYHVDLDTSEISEKFKKIINRASD